VALTEIGKIRYAQATELAKTDREAAAPVYQVAIDIFRRRIALDQDSDEAYYYVGLACRELDRIPAALEAMRSAVALAPEKPERHFWFGLLCVQSDSAGRAEEEFERVVALEQGNSASKAIALQQLGYYRLLRREYAAAIERLEASVAINPQDPNTLLWLAQGYQNSGNRAKAVENYRRVLALNPGSADARNGLKLLEGGAR
jgi:tetratricopeptide (TPR) repeat protein